MMVIQIENYQPHEYAVCVCLECFARHVAVYPTSVKFPLECHVCGEMACEIDIQHVTEKQ